MANSTTCGACADYTRSQLLAQGVARAGEGLPSIEMGMPTPAGSGLSRRSFMAGAAGLSLTVFGAAALGPGIFNQGIEAASAAAPVNPIIISIWLSGGLDSLDLLAPANDPIYRSLRPTLRQAPTGDTLDIFTEDTRLQWHPKARPIRDLHREGKVTVMPGIGFGSSHGSHFTSRHFWEVGELNEAGRVGWLGRYLDREGTADNPLQGLSLDSFLSPVIAPASAPVASILYPEDYWIGIKNISNVPLVTRAFQAAIDLAQTSDNGDPSIHQANAATSSMMGVGGKLSGIQGITAQPEGGAAYPGGWFGGRLAMLAEMIDRGLPLRCVTLQGPGGYDTHASQSGIVPNNLDILSKSIYAFQRDIEARGAADRVLIHVYSEFGRRVADNGSGTDHGAAGASLLIGKQASGRMVGEFPGLESLDQYGNLLTTVDYRAVYCSLLEQWLGTDAAGIIPGASGFARPTLIAS